MCITFIFVNFIIALYARTNRSNIQFDGQYRTCVKIRPLQSPYKAPYKVFSTRLFCKSDNIQTIIKALPRVHFHKTASTLFYLHVSLPGSSASDLIIGLAFSHTVTIEFLSSITLIVFESVTSFIGAPCKSIGLHRYADVHVGSEQREEDRLHLSHQS